MKLLKNIFYLFLPLILGSLIGILIKDSIDYEYLIQPLLSPPKILFPIVWTILYILMGISFYLYKKNAMSDDGEKLYYIQLFFNLMWSILFFVFKLRFISTVWIIILDILIFMLLKIYKNRYKTSFYLNIPYFIWTLFATYLTFSIYLLN